MKNLKTMNLQMYAEPAPTPAPAPSPAPNPAPAPSPTPAPVEIDYDKLAQLISGKQAATEDSLLKGYFKQQGLSQQEAEQAIAAFKAEKAKNQPDVGALQTQVTQAQAAAQQAQIQAAATMEAVSLGIDAKSLPYILKLADFSQAIGQDGKINNETVNNALKKVLEDVPALKPQTAGTTGFVQVGAASGNAGAGQAQQATQTQQTGVPAKRWNRWNN